MSTRRHSSSIIPQASGLVQAYRTSPKELIYDECVSVRSDANGEDGTPLVKGAYDVTTSLPCKLTYEGEDYEDPDAILPTSSPKQRATATPVLSDGKKKPVIETNYSHSNVILFKPTQQPASPSIKKHTYVNVPESSEVYAEEEIYDDAVAAPVKSNIHFQTSLEMDELYDDAVTIRAHGTIIFQESAKEDEIYDDTMALSSAEKDLSPSSPPGDDTYDHAVFSPNVVNTYSHISSPINDDVYDDVDVQSCVREDPAVDAALSHTSASPYEEVSMGPMNIDYEEIDEPPMQIQASISSQGRRKLSQRRSHSSSGMKNGLNRSPPMIRARVAGEESVHHPPPQPREHRPLGKSQSAGTTQPLSVMRNRPLPTLPAATPPAAVTSPGWQSRMFPLNPVRAVPAGVKRRDSIPSTAPPPVPQHRKISPSRQARASPASSHQQQSSPSTSHKDNPYMAPPPPTSASRVQSELFPSFSTIAEDPESTQAPPTPPRHRRLKPPDVRLQRKSDPGPSPVVSYRDQSSPCSCSPPFPVVSETESDDDKERSTPSGLLAEIQKVKLKKTSEPSSFPPPRVSPKPAMLPSSKGGRNGVFKTQFDS